MLQQNLDTQQNKYDTACRFGMGLETLANHAAKVDAARRNGAGDAADQDLSLIHI